MTDKFTYFAYGSNILEARLKERCSSARPIGTGHLTGHILDFSKKSKDGSGKATIVKTGSDDDHVYGRLFEIKNNETCCLDKAEGYNANSLKGYDKNTDYTVLKEDGTVEKDVTSYIAFSNSRDPSLIPYDWYLALIIAGYKEAELPDNILEDIKATPFITTENSDPDKIKTRALLEISGFDMDELLAR